MLPQGPKATVQPNKDRQNETRIGSLKISPDYTDKSRFPKEAFPLAQRGGRKEPTKAGRASHLLSQGSLESGFEREEAVRSRSMVTYLRRMLPLAEERLRLALRPLAEERERDMEDLCRLVVERDQPDLLPVMLPLLVMLPLDVERLLLV